MGLWCLLEEHPEHTVVLDDISTLFNEVSALQILMAALGGNPGQSRTITYTTKDKHERKSFEFTGGIIAISNVPLRRDPLADAVASRVVSLEHEPSDEMIAAFMRKQALSDASQMEGSSSFALNSEHRLAQWSMANNRLRANRATTSLPRSP